MSLPGLTLSRFQVDFVLGSASNGCVRCGIYRRTYRKSAVHHRSYGLHRAFFSARIIGRLLSYIRRSFASTMLLALFNELLGNVRGLSAVPMPLYLVLYRAIENGLPGMPDGDDIRMKNSLE